MAERPPRVPGHPVVGNTVQFFRQNTLDFFTESAAETGDVAELRLAGKSAYLLSHPEAVWQVMVDKNDKFEKGEGIQKIVTESLLGEGLVTNDGESWRQQRRILDEAFHPEYIQRYTPVITEHAQELVASWEEGDVLNLQEELQHFTFNIITDALFSIDLRGDPRGEEFIDAFTAIIDHFTFIADTYVYIPEQIPTPGNQRYKEALATLDEFIYNAIEERRASDSDGTDVLSVLLAAQEKEPGRVDDKQIRDEMATLMLAGHETTALALTYTLYSLSKQPIWKRKIREEVTAEVGDGPVTGDDVDALDVTERVLTESMRLHPPTFAVFRSPTEDAVVKGYEVPEGAVLILSQWVTQRDSRFFENPLAFNPNRWTDEFREELHPGAYFPFAAGPRRCLGEQFAMLEAKIGLTAILQNTELELLSPESLQCEPSLTTHPTEDIMMRVTDTSS